MRVKSCNSDARFLNAHQPQGLLRECNHIGDALLLHASRYIMQSDVGGHMDDAQLRACEHHGVFRLPHEAAEDLRMSRIVQSAEMECLLVQQRGDNRMNRAVHRIRTGTLDVLVRRASRTSVHLCKGEVSGEVRKIDNVDCPRLIVPICRSLHRMTVYLCTDNTHGAFHDLRISVDERTGNTVYFRIRECLDDDLGSDPRRIAHCDSKNRTQHSFLPHSYKFRIV